MSANNQRQGARVSRNQEQREAEPVHEEFPILFEESGPLPDIKPRPGYVQRWIRVQKSAVEQDSRNIYAASRMGWNPRTSDTVSKNEQFMVVQREGMGGVIGTHDMVLMERPIQINEKAKKYERDKRRSLEKAVKQSMFSEHRSLGGEDAGIRAPQHSTESVVERGRPMIADD